LIYWKIFLKFYNTVSIFIIIIFIIIIIIIIIIYTDVILSLLSAHLYFLKQLTKIWKGNEMEKTGC